MGVYGPWVSSIGLQAGFRREGWRELAERMYRVRQGDVEIAVYLIDLAWLLRETPDILAIQGFDAISRARWTAELIMENYEGKENNMEHRYRKDLSSIHFVRLNKFRGAYFDYRKEGRFEERREQGIYRWPVWKEKDGTWSGPRTGPLRQGEVLMIAKRDFHDICRGIRVKPEEMLDSFIKLSILDGRQDENGDLRWIRDNLLRIDAANWDKRHRSSNTELPSCAVEA